MGVGEGIKETHTLLGYFLYIQAGGVKYCFKEVTPTTNNPHWKLKEND